MCPQVHYNIMYAFTGFPLKKRQILRSWLKLNICHCFHRFIASIAHCKWTPLYSLILAAVIPKYNLAVVCFSQISCVKTLEWPQCFKTRNSSQSI